MISSKHLQNIIIFPSINAIHLAHVTQIQYLKMSSSKKYHLRDCPWVFAGNWNHRNISSRSLISIPLSSIEISCSFISRLYISFLQDGATFLSLPQGDPEFLSFPTNTGKTASSSASGAESLHSDPLITPPSDTIAGAHFSPAKSKSSSGTRH